MCVIICCDKKSGHITKKMLKNAEQSNNDGMGIAWINKNNKVQWVKGLTSKNMMKLIIAIQEVAAKRSEKNDNPAAVTAPPFGYHWYANSRSLIGAYDLPSEITWFLIVITVNAVCCRLSSLSPGHPVLSAKDIDIIDETMRKIIKIVEDFLDSKNFGFCLIFLFLIT